MKKILYDEKYVVDIKDDRYAFYCPVSSNKINVYKKYFVTGQAIKHPVTECIESELENATCPISLFAPFVRNLEKINTSKVLRKGKDIYLKCEMYDGSGWIINFSKYLKSFERTEDKMYLENCDYLGSEEIGLLLIQHNKKFRKFLEERPNFRYMHVVNGYGAVTNAQYMINFKVDLEDGVYDEFLNKKTNYEPINFVSVYNGLDKDIQYKFDGYTDELFYSATYFNAIFGMPFDIYGNYNVLRVYQIQSYISPFGFFIDYKNKTLFYVVMSVKSNFHDSFFNFIQKGGDE